MTDTDYHAARAAEHATAKPGEWCGPCDDWIVNCGHDEPDERFIDDEPDPHDVGACDGPGCCAWCDGRAEVSR